MIRENSSQSSPISSLSRRKLKFLTNAVVLFYVLA
jgi:hypothetical protein